MWKLVFSFSILGILTSCNQQPAIERAEYLEKIHPNYPGYKTFLVRSSYFNKPSCTYLEKWAKANIKSNSENSAENYTFLNYDKELTLKNPYLNKEYDAIIGDYYLCKMNNDDYKCYLCVDGK